MNLVRVNSWYKVVYERVDNQVEEGVVWFDFGLILWSLSCFLFGTRYHTYVLCFSFILIHVQHVSLTSKMNRILCKHVYESDSHKIIKQPHLKLQVMLLIDYCFLSRVCELSMIRLAQKKGSHEIIISVCLNDHCMLSLRAVCIMWW